MKLYIAEKPSVARAIAHVLAPSAKSENGIYSAGDVVVAPLSGHVLEQAKPHEYAERFKEWRLEDLPIVPETWKKLVKSEFKGRISAVGKLLKRASVVVHAGDPDREGQLIVDEVLDHLGYHGPVRRVLPNEIEETGLREILANEHDNREFAALSESARAREQNDFLVGISATRAVTLIGQQQGYRGMTFTVGRVQTPTLALVVRREREIESFVPIDHYAVVATMAHERGAFEAIWQPDPTQVDLDPEGRLLDRSTAEAIVARVQGKSGRVVSYKDERKKANPPPPFSLNALQAKASRLFRIPVAQVLEIAQALYEKHKLTTYPRSDSKYLPTSQHAIAGDVLQAVAATSRSLAPLIDGADASRRSPAFKDTKDPHHAIVPTRRHGDISQLNELERKVYELIAKSYIAQFYPPYEYRTIEAEVEIDGERFLARGKIPLNLGWRAVLGTDDKDERGDDEAPPIPPLAQGDAARCSAAEVKEKKTEPPPRFSQASLVAAMERIDKFVQNPEVKARLRSVKGIGTSATQAPIVEGLLTRGYLEERDHKLYATAPAVALIEVLERAVWPLTDPGLTALMEQTLESVAEGRLTCAQHTAQVVAFMNKVIVDLKAVKFPAPPAGLPTRRAGGASRRSKGAGAFRKRRGSWKPSRAKRRETS
ncbi:DNA topoisomerase III [bacterium]|nr:MAG: DNA topoisomerase III [bacterium]